MAYNKKTFTNSNDTSLSARDELFESYENYHAPQDEKERSLALFLRGSQLARILAIQEIYKEILNIPGAIFDLGTWRGTTPVLCENFRAIYEPLNFQRHIYAFDTFEGYKGFKEEENRVSDISNGTYGVEESYENTLEKILLLHERNNAMGHINGKHQVIKGDVTQTIPLLLDENPGLSIALAFFDLNCYEPTKEALQLITNRLLNGGIIAFWQFNRKEIQAESELFFELLHSNINYTIHKCETYPSLIYIKKES